MFTIKNQCDDHIDLVRKLFRLDVIDSEGIIRQ